MIVHVSEFVVGVWDGLDEREIYRPKMLSQSAPAKDDPPARDSLHKI